MSISIRLDGPRLEPKGGTPDRLIVLLHGLGADGDDLIGLAPHWQSVLPTAAFIAPNAPFPCDMAPYGYQWFSLQDRTPARILAGVQAAAPMLDAFLDELLESYRLGPERLALVGFSQGTMMAMHVAMRRDKPVAGVVGFSGALVGAELLAEDIRSRPPVLLVHGDADQIVPVQASRLALGALEAAGIKARLVVRPGLPHSIDGVGLTEGAAFLREAFGAG
ncbi:MAG TPA: alpha/beta fold hydrolase [Azospirillaceae bacterium]|nr:alpha/beta fold hydrolase [Azospirillaceae bacterium]